MTKPDSYAAKNGVSLANTAAPAKPIPAAGAEPEPKRGNDMAAARAAVGKKRGFAAMTPEKRSAIARLGGKALKPEQRSFSKDKTLAAEAGRKGGSNLSGSKRAYSTDSALASRAGRLGGLAGAASRRKTRMETAE